MININTNVANANTAVSANSSVTNNGSAVDTSVKGNASVNTGASVVNLQTGAYSSDAAGSVKVDATNAKSMVADIAAMLGKSGNSVQANLNGFDAARLLA